MRDDPRCGGREEGGERGRGEESGGDGGEGPDVKCTEGGDGEEEVALRDEVGEGRVEDESWEEAAARWRPGDEGAVFHSYGGKGGSTRCEDDVRREVVCPERLTQGSNDHLARSFACITSSIPDSDGRR